MLMCLKSFFEYSCFIPGFLFLDKYSVVWTLVTKRDNKMVFLMTQKVETNGRRVLIFFSLILIDDDDYYFCNRVIE